MENILDITADYSMLALSFAVPVPQRAARLALHCEYLNLNMLLNDYKTNGWSISDIRSDYLVKVKVECLLFCQIKPEVNFSLKSKSDYAVFILSVLSSVTCSVNVSYRLIKHHLFYVLILLCFLIEVLFVLTGQHEDSTGPALQFAAFFHH